MDNEKHIATMVDNQGIATITLTRGEKHNALNKPLALALTEAINNLQHEPKIRALVLQGEGKSFCAGADINETSHHILHPEDDQSFSFKHLSDVFQALERFTRPTLCVAQGNVFGGGLGLLACCDIVIADTSATFCISETKLGLVPTIIFPYLEQKIGISPMRYYTLSAMPFGAERAQNLGLVHEIVEKQSLHAKRDELIQKLLEGSPNAQQKSKTLFHHLLKPLNDEFIDYNLEFNRLIFASDDAKEGTAAFLEKRKPNWDTSS